MKLKVNISPCPNDTFMFDAMLNGRTDTEGLDFEFYFSDIEELNLRALRGEADIIKISYAVLPEVTGSYALSGSGNTLGRGNGPVFVGKGVMDAADPDLRMAVPGLRTTAAKLLGILYPGLTRLTPVLFSEIAERVLSGDFDAGVLIHEGRFTYRRRGLEKIADLGALWEKRSGLPLPLGAIAVSRSLPYDVQEKAERVLRRSIEYAFANPTASSDFVRSHARELDMEVIANHINLFVNSHSLALDEEGFRAVEGFTGLKREQIFV